MSEQGSIMVHALSLLQQMIEHFGEAGANPNRDGGTAEAQRLLGWVRGFADAPAQALFAEHLHDGPVGFELEIGMTNHGAGEIAVRRTSQLSAPDLPRPPGVTLHATVSTGHVVYHQELEPHSMTPPPAGMSTPDAPVCE